MRLRLSRLDWRWSGRWLKHIAPLASELFGRGTFLTSAGSLGEKSAFLKCLTRRAGIAKVHNDFQGLGEILRGHVVRREADFDKQHKDYHRLLLAGEPIRLDFDHRGDFINRLRDGEFEPGVSQQGFDSGQERGIGDDSHIMVLVCGFV